MTCGLERPEKKYQKLDYSKQSGPNTGLWLIISVRSVKATELSTVVGARKGHGTQMLASINLDMNPFTGHSLYPELFNSEPAPTHWILCMCGCLCTVCVCVCVYVLKGPQKALHSLAQTYPKAVIFILRDLEGTFHLTELEPPAIPDQGFITDV